MAVRSEADATDGFGHLFGTLYECVIEGVRDYYREYAAQAYLHRVTTRRSIIRDHIVNRLRESLSEQRGVEILNRHGTTLFGLVSEFLLKAHKLSAEKRIALNDNQHSLAFQENVVEACLPGEEFEGATALYIGYVPNRMDPLTPQVFLVCPKADGHEWALELRREGGATIIEPPTKPGLDPEDLVVVRPTPAREREDE